MSIINQRVNVTLTGRDWIRLNYIDTKVAKFDIEIDINKLVKAKAWKAINNKSGKTRMERGAIVISYEGYQP